MGNKKRVDLDNISFTVGKSIVIDKSNAEDFRDVLGDALVDAILDADDNPPGMYKVTDIGGEGKPFVLTRDEDETGRNT